MRRLIHLKLNSMDLIRYLVRSRLMTFIRKWDLVNFLLGSIDILAIALAFQGAYYLNYHNIGDIFLNQKKFLILFVVILPIWLIILYLIKNTEIPRTKRYRVMFLEYLQSATIMLVLILSIFIVLRFYTISVVFQVELIVFGFLLLFAVRILEYKVFKIYRAKGYNQVNVGLNSR